MTSYQFNINGQALTGTLGWNANGTLGTQNTVDAFNSTDTQNCSYTHDDLVRIASVNCGATKWQQNFTYDAFGNITKTVPVGGTGNSFLPTYSATTNHITSLPGFTPTYDANGNVTADGSHTYSWDANGNSITLDGVGLTFDALDRMVEQNRSGVFTEIVYTPGGQKFALMTGATLQKAFVPLPGQAAAVYTPGGLAYYRHTDHLGSSRLVSTPTRTVSSTVAYAPFGETYVSSGTPDRSFTGQNQDTVSGDYDFLAREYSNQGRWASPDPAGLAAVDVAVPQSWNRYAYVENLPNVFVDPFGLEIRCYGGKTYDHVVASVDGEVTNDEINYVGDDCGRGGGGGGVSRGGGGGGGGGGSRSGNKVSCTAQRIASGLMGGANLGLAIYKAPDLVAVVLALSGTAAGAPAAGVLGAYGTTSLFGQALAGTAQLYSAATGNYGTPAKVAQAGTILSGPVSGLGTLAAGGSAATAERNAGLESMFTAGTGFVSGIQEMGAAQLAQITDWSIAFLGLAPGASAGCGGGH
jgi:RHS repeat-associated protein